MTIKGWMSPVYLQWMAEQAKTATCIIEIGVYEGRSTRVMADSMLSGTLYAVDSWEYANPHHYEQFQVNLQDHIASGRVQIVKERSLTAYNQFRAGQADLVFIDGGHAYAEVLSDCQLYQTVVRPGGILAGHDYQSTSYPEVTLAVDKIFPKVQLVKAPRGPQLWWVQL